VRLSTLSTGERLALPVGEATKWAPPEAAFSPTEPTLLAISAVPASHQVTLFRIVDGTAVLTR
jgi:hypothetical protein